MYLRFSNPRPEEAEEGESLKHFSFVLWMVLYPLTCVVYSTMRLIWIEPRLSNSTPTTETTRAFDVLIQTAIWVYIGMKLWKAA